MRNLAVLWLLSAAPLMLSCGGGHNGKADADVATVKVDVTKQADIHDVCASFDGYVCLETNDSSIIQTITKVEQSGDTLYIYDYDKQRLQLFSRKDGAWLGKIDRRGRGPGEYVRFEDFDVFGSEVYILANEKINVYRPDGTIVRTIPLEYGYQKLKVMEKDRIWLYSERSNDGLYDFVLIDSNTGKVLRQEAEFTENRSYTYVGSRPFCGEYDGCLYTVKEWDNTVYVLSDDGYMPAFRLDMNLQYHISQEELATRGYDELSEEYRYKEALRDVKHVCRQGNSVMFIIRCLFNELAIRYCLIKADLLTGETSFYRFRDNLKNDYPFFDIGFYAGAYEDVFISEEDAESSIEFGKKYGYPELAALSEYDNPVLFFHKIKM